MKEFRYEIAGKVYVQRPIVLGQLKQLMGIMRGTILPKELNATGVIAVLGEKLSEAVAVVVCEEGTSLKDKDVLRLAGELEFNIEPELALKVIEDFFICNPVSSLLERLTGVMEKVNLSMAKTPSTGSSASLPKETSQSKTPSSGDSRPRSAGRI